MRFFILLCPAFIGCAAPRATVSRPSEVPVKPASPVATKIVETAYEVRAYRDPSDRAVSHGEHTIYRRSVVPVAVADGESISRTRFAPATYAPLPVSAELNAELEKQRTLTVDLQAIKASMAETQQALQVAYARLVTQTADVTKLRDELTVERERLRTPTPAAVVEPGKEREAKVTDKGW